MTSAERLGGDDLRSGISSAETQHNGAELTPLHLSQSLGFGVRTESQLRPLTSNSNSPTSDALPYLFQSCHKETAGYGVPRFGKQARPPPQAPAQALRRFRAHQQLFMAEE